jgi:mono/diheme cytochrome c family protein
MRGVRHAVRRDVRRAAVLAAGLLLLATSCAPAYRGAARDGPLDTSDPAVAAGQRLFDLHCHQCHPGASAGLGPSVTPSPTLVRLQVRLGLGAMPAFDRTVLPDADLDAIVAYVVALRERGIEFRRP